jgi:DNA topoisomerase I
VVTPPNQDPQTAAKSAGLRYVSDERPGITRAAAGGQFRYRDSQGRAVTDAATLGRIKRLAIPPAWTGVWICPQPDGHIQATGRDARGRKQYRYHHDWRSTRDETKYNRMLAFGRALPRIRRRVARDLRQRGLGRNKVLAAMVRLLETTLVRVGNEEYARANGSVGLSTMQDRHVQVKRGTMAFRFKGKSGKHHHIELHDAKLARLVRRVQELPGQDLFQYVDDQGQTQDVKSEDVNNYLREAAGADFSAKDFRTWAGTVLAAIALRQFEQFETKAQAKKNMVVAIERVAQRLGNTPAVCRKCYIHPAILDSYLDGRTVEVILHRTEEALAYGLPALSGAEGAVLAFLQQHLRRAAHPPALLTSLRRSVAATRRGPRGGGRQGGAAGGARGAAKSHKRKPRPSAHQSPRGR